MEWEVVKGEATVVVAMVEVAMAEEARVEVAMAAEAKVVVVTGEAETEEVE